MKIPSISKKGKQRDLLWHWVQYHEGTGVMPGEICRSDSSEVTYMTVFDPRVLDRLVGKKK